MTVDGVLRWLPYLFPLFLVGLWLGVTTMLWFLSGWFGLQQRYPDDGREQPSLKLSGQSGRMGFGVGFNGVLKLRSYPSGVGVGIWRLFGPFQKPLKIPWSDIEAERSVRLFLPMVKLRFGKPSDGTLTISARSWSRLLDAVPRTGGSGERQMPPAPPVSRTSVALGLFLQWLAISAFMATFFYLASRSNGPGGGVPLGICIGFPALVVGIGQLARFAREG